jgi:hypothetical protein
MKTLYMYCRQFQQWLFQARYREQLRGRIRRLTGAPEPLNKPEQMRVAEKLMTGLMIALYLSLWWMIFAAYRSASNRPPQP